MPSNFVKPATELPDPEKEALYTLLGEFHSLSERRAIDTARDKAIRTQLHDTYFKGEPEGTSTMKMDFGKALKCAIKINRSVVKEALAEHQKKLGLDPQSNSLIVKQNIIDKVVVYKPEVSVTAWKALTDAERAEVADIVIEKLGLPELEIATPKR